MELDKELMHENTDNMSLDEFITIATSVDNRLRRFKARHQSRSALTPRPAPPRPAGPPTTSSAPSVPSTSTGTHPGPMDVSANARRLSPQEKARRMKEGLCWYCGDANHIARNCPRRAMNPLRAHETILTAAPEPADSESGKA